MTTRQLGSPELNVFPLALGCSAFSHSTGNTEADQESIATIKEAIECGVQVIDTADFYGCGHNEALLAQAIKGQRDKVILSLKFGGQRSPDGAFIGIDNRPNSVKNYLSYSLTRLGVDYIDIYRPARLDPTVPIEDTIGAIADLVQAGYVRHIGLSEMGADTIARAHAVHPICDVQLEYSLFSRGPEEKIFPVLNELGIGVTAYGVLSHGLLSDSTRDASAKDWRVHLPRFQGENYDRNAALVKQFQALAKEMGYSTSQLATAWAMSKGDNSIALIGPKNRTQLHESLKSAAIQLTPGDIEKIEMTIPLNSAVGDRYPTPLMKMLDSEK